MANKYVQRTSRAKTTAQQSMLRITICVSVASHRQQRQRSQTDFDLVREPLRASLCAVRPWALANGCKFTFHNDCVPRQQTRFVFASPPRAYMFAVAAVLTLICFESDTLCGCQHYRFLNDRVPCQWPCIAFIGPPIVYGIFSSRCIFDLLTYSGQTI